LPTYGAPRGRHHDHDATSEDQSHRPEAYLPKCGAYSPFSQDVGLLLAVGGSNTVAATVIPRTHTSPEIEAFTSAQTKVPGIAGKWQAGFCGKNADNHNETIKGAGNASGWIEVVNQAF
jgi:hypothetical protein